jgi:cytosine/adenosine deaminase-related metal-dependent hydrolase
MATLGGAAVLGRSEIGSLEVGKCADFLPSISNGWITRRAARSAGGAAVLQPGWVDYNVVGGKFIVKEGQLQTLDLDTHIRKHNQAARGC